MAFLFHWFHKCDVLLCFNIFLFHLAVFLVPCVFMAAFMQLGPRRHMSCIMAVTCHSRAYDPPPPSPGPIYVTKSPGPFLHLPVVSRMSHAKCRPKTMLCLPVWRAVLEWQSRLDCVNYYVSGSLVAVSETPEHFRAFSAHSWPAPYDSTARLARHRDT